MDQFGMHRGAWHPWLLVERATRAILADRMTHGASDTADAALVKAIEDRQRIERAGWFN